MIKLKCNLCSFKKLSFLSDVCSINRQNCIGIRISKKIKTENFLLKGAIILQPTVLQLRSKIGKIEEFQRYW